jgi:hypothetical protein
MDTLGAVANGEELRSETSRMGTPAMDESGPLEVVFELSTCHPVAVGGTFE